MSSKKCPYCKENIQVEAKKCRYCGEWLTNGKKQNKITQVLKKYYLIWLFSIIAFFTTFFLSVNGLISDNTVYILISIFGLTGLLSFVNLIRNLFMSQSIQYRTRYLFLIVVNFALFLFLAVKDPPVLLNTNNIGNFGTTPLCSRSEQYDMPPEFQRALSLLNQRNEEKLQSLGYDETQPEDEIDQINKKMGKVVNCLDIQYADLSSYGAEGIFTVDPNSTPDRLKIYVDSSFKSNDDLLTALLLSHEVTHARQYYYDLLGEKGTLTRSDGSLPTPHEACLNKEVEAFLDQYVTITTFNEEELKSVIFRLGQGEYANPAYGNVKSLLSYATEANNSCGDLESQCALSVVTSQIYNYVHNNPYYIEQCNANVNN